MKKLILSVVICFPFIAFGQIPPAYYNTAIGSGNTLRTALRNIIRPHTELTYTPGLWNAYYKTDVKPSGKLWDIYSDIPGGTPAYEYTMGSGQCSGGSPTAEGGCYNREHTWPQSKFGSNPPMQTDLFIVIPTDYYVNGQRGDLPYGKVGTATHTFTNGSKLGNNVYSGAPSGSCYEPLDSFKGDLARTYFYVATCYYGSDSTNFINWEIANGINFKPWAVQMLLEWHHNDPVSGKELRRNDSAYKIQNNRNPFIDHPEYADCIWGAGPCPLSINDVKHTQSAIVVSTVNTNHSIVVDWNREPQNMVNTVSVLNMNGQVIYSSPLMQGTNYRSLSVNTETWAHGIYMVRINCENTVEVRKVVVE